jgi:O-antigen ligase
VALQNPLAAGSPGRVLSAPRTAGGSPLGRLCRHVLRRPVWAAAGTVALACVPNGTTDVAASYHVTPADLGAAMFVGVSALSAIRDRRRLPRPIAVALGVLVAALAVAALTSADVVAGLSGFIRYAELFAVLPAAVVLSLRDREDFRILAGALVGMALLEGAVGTRQALTGTGASVNGQNVRAVGTFGALDITGMAEVVAYGVLVAFGYGLAAERGRRKTAAFLVATVLLVPLAYSQSRGAWIATAVAGLAILVLHSPRTALRVAVAGAALGIAVAGYSSTHSGGGGAGNGSPQLSGRLSSLGSAVGVGSGGADQSVQDRYGLWQAAGEIWQSHPVFGVGLKEFPSYRDAHAPMDLSAYSDADDPSLGYVREPLLTPHNVYLLVLSEQGLVGMAAFGLLAVVIAAGLVKGMRARPTGYQRAAGLAVTGFVVWQGVDFLYADLGGVVSLVLSLFLGVACWWSGRAAEEQPDRA